MLSFTIGAGATASPSTPTNVIVTAGPGRATLSFMPPATTGGAPIASYTATCVDSGTFTRSVTGTASSLVASGFKAGAAYTCWVTTSNRIYTSAASASLAVTPKVVDQTPTLILLLD